jgi:hypothetical protein
MNACRALFVVACLVPVAALPAAAQFSPAPQQSAAPSPWDQQPQQAPWPQPGQQGPQGLQGLQPPQQVPQLVPQQTQEKCMEDFGKLRSDAEKKAAAIRAASARKATAKEACALFTSFSDAEARMIKFVVDSSARCGIPAELTKNMKQGHVKSSEIRTRVCEAAASPARAAGPSLNDALSAPIPDASNVKSGRGAGTYDTLSGTPLSPK